MCGIAGWVDWTRGLREERKIIDAMMEALASRGPDGRGVWTSDSALFGHRRLSVIDIQEGAQPMAAERESRSAVLTYGGEIYNYKGLASELRDRGVVFRARSGTEVVLQSYLEWGHVLIDCLEGMFAIAIWDVSTRELALGRDPLGIKPLFYFEYDGGCYLDRNPKCQSDQGQNADRRRNLLIGFPFVGSTSGAYSQPMSILNGQS
jgi:asparagine synthase (glutamine-hydrolysing)